jgi:hypothetical protein
MAMETLLRIAHIVALPCHLFARLAGFMLLILTAVIMYDVIGRRFFNTGSFVVSDLKWHLHGAIAILCFGYAYVRDAHVQDRHLRPSHDPPLPPASGILGDCPVRLSVLRAPVLVRL